MALKHMFLIAMSEMLGKATPAVVFAGPQLLKIRYAILVFTLQEMVIIPKVVF